MGLRSLYHVVEWLRDKFIYLDKGIAVILTFIGVKMLADKFLTISPLMSLSVVVGILLVAALASAGSTNARRKS